MEIKIEIEIGSERGRYRDRDGDRERDGDRYTFKDLKRNGGILKEMKGLERKLDPGRYRKI